MFFWKKKHPKLQDIASSSYQIVDLETIRLQNYSGWFDPDVAARQNSAYRSLIQKARAGEVRQDLKVATEAIQATGLKDPHVLEVGCGSGYYYEILSYLLKRDLYYVGIDNSQVMTGLAKINYPAKSFITGDAARLPFGDESFDIVFNGDSLMHTLEYHAAVSESRRVACKWCIFHTVPILKLRPTTTIAKTAYGTGLVVEIIYNEQDLFAIFAKNNLKVRFEAESIPYNLEELLHEKTTTKTYLCEVIQR